MDFHPEWHQGEVGYLRSLYNRVPVNARMLVENVLGRTAPITEKDFSPSDLEAIRQQYQRQMNVLSDEYAMNRSRQESLTPGNALQYDPIGAAQGASGQDVFARMQGDLAGRVGRYERMMANRRIPVDRYAGQSGHMDEQGWGKTLRDLGDPDARIASTLGRYVVQEHPQGAVAYDTYDFNRYGSEKDEGLSWNALAHPVAMADMMMRKYNLGHPLPVEIMLRSQR